MEDWTFEEEELKKDKETEMNKSATLLRWHALSLYPRCEEVHCKRRKCHSTVNNRHVCLALQTTILNSTRVQGGGSQTPD